MCGIVGYIGKDKCIPKIIKGLETLEYRGYDSVGVAYKIEDKVVIKKEEGKVKGIEKQLKNDINSYIGIGHTRWATHGKPCKINSHPHRMGKITLVHNGIIENYEELKDLLKEYHFKSETDSEVIAALIDKLYNEDKDMLKVLNKLKNYLKGSYALGILVSDRDELYAIRKDSPLIIGISEDGNYLASDVPAILEYTNMYYILLDNEFAVLTSDDVSIYDANSNICDKNLEVFEGNQEVAMKNGYEHYMLKEIFEQPKVVMETLNDYISSYDSLKKKLNGLEKYEAIDIVGCGSAYHVGLVGKYLMAKYGKIVVNADIASEYRYTEHIYSKKHLIILISQSGETADTLAVLRKAKEDNIDTLAIVNVVGSSIAREADRVLYIKAGPEIAVATTKAYLCQMMILSLMALYLGINNNILEKDILDEYKNLDKLIMQELEHMNQLEKIAKLIYQKKDIFYLGRKIDYALCLEASLKLKEVSYLHSEAYAAGELKHGTISLIEDKTPVISIITDDNIRYKTISNVKEVRARKALSIIISNEEIKDKSLYDELILISKANELISGALVMVNCQLLAYYVAKLRGCDIDKPRNLAKSVTVE